MNNTIETIKTFPDEDIKNYVNDYYDKLYIFDTLSAMDKNNLDKKKKKLFTELMIAKMTNEIKLTDAHRNFITMYMNKLPKVVHKV